VQRIHARIGNARRDFLRKATTTFRQNHAIVCSEALPVRNLSKSAARKVDHPGNNVRAKTGLNKSISEQEGFESRRQLDHKLARSGGRLIAATKKMVRRRNLWVDFCHSAGYLGLRNR